MTDYKAVLLEKERELTARTKRLMGEARETIPGDVADFGDVASANAGASEVVELNEVESHILGEVRDALRRLESGAYGKCIECGRPIGEARLAAVPWTPYCHQHQELHDKMLGRSRTGPE